MTNVNAAPVQPATMAADRTRLPDPISRAGRGAIDFVAGGVQWYLEQWEDRVHEVRADRTRRFATEGLTAGDVLAGLDQATVSSDIPGRVRLRVAALRRQDAVAAQTAAALSQLAGVHSAEANPLTGSVLVIYDRKRYPSLDKLLASARKRGAGPQRTKSRSAT